MASFDERSYVTDDAVTRDVQIKYQVRKSEGEEPKKKKGCPDLRIETVLFISTFSYVLRGVTSTTLIMDKVCLVHLNLSAEVCSNLSAYPDHKVQVERVSDNYNVCLLLLQLVPASLLSCVVGAWSDRHGRKPPLLLALAGATLDAGASTACALTPSSPVQLFVAAALLSGLSGGVIGILAVLYSCATDATPQNQRTWKFTQLEVTFGLAVPLGQLSGGWLSESAGGPAAVFAASAAGSLLAAATVGVALPESRRCDDPWAVKLRRLCSLQPAIECARAAAKWRPRQGRRQILLLILSMGIVVLASSSTINIGYMYAHQLFDWDNAFYSTVSAAFCAAGTVALLAGAPLYRRLGDATLGLVGTASLLLKNVGLGLATAHTRWIYFGANLAGVLTGLATLAGRSRISKVASEEDVGKVFAFTMTAETLIPVLSVVLVAQVFNATVDFFPGLVFLVLAIPLLVPIGVFIWLACLPYDFDEELEDELHIHSDGEPVLNAIN